MLVVYSFEIKSIQHYILDSGKLKDMVASSEQIEDLCHGLLDPVLDALELKEGKNINFIRKAAGGFTAILEVVEQAEKLRDLWTFTVRNTLPGVEFVHGLAEHEKIMDAEQAVLEQKIAYRSRFFPEFPIAGPFVARSPRLGEPAIEEIPNPEGGTERLDKRTSRKRNFLNKIKQSRLEHKFQLEARPGEKVIWPKNMEPDEDPELYFPTLGENRYIGVMHADGNSFTEMMMHVRDSTRHLAEEEAIAIYKNVSDAIASMTENAASQATRSVLTDKAEERKVNGRKLRVMPARPLVLGGDDLTIIVRGDLVLPFTKAFLEAFERCSEEELCTLKKRYQKTHLRLPDILTACAGIAFIKSSQPFYLAYRLTESLCKTAKRISKQHPSVTKRVPSSIAFHRITTSVIDEYETILGRELRTPVGVLSMQPYAVGKVCRERGADVLPRLSDLDRLRALLMEERVSQGAARELMNLLYLSRSRAKSALSRWQENMLKTQPEGLRELQSVLQSLLGKMDGELFVLNAAGQTPLADALAWNSVARGGNDEISPL